MSPAESPGEALYVIVVLEVLWGSRHGVVEGFSSSPLPPR